MTRGAHAAASSVGGMSMPMEPALGGLHTVAADPTRIPPPIHRDRGIHHEVTLEAREFRASLADGAEFVFMTWNGQIPGPMIRVRQGDTITLTVRNAATNTRPHCIDIHAIYGSSGGCMATLVPPGGTRREFFKCTYPGAFVYHCGVPYNADEHISCGMFGMILVEPHDGLPAVDREFYFGQHELYTREPFGASGLLSFDYEAMARADANFVLFNAMVRGLTSGGIGAMRAKVGETVRIFMVNGARISAPASIPSAIFGRDAGRREHWRIRRSPTYRPSPWRPEAASSARWSSRFPAALTWSTMRYRESPAGVCSRKSSSTAPRTPRFSGS